VATTTIVVCDRCKGEVKGGKTWHVMVTLLPNKNGTKEVDQESDMEQLLEVKELGPCCLGLLRDRIKDFSSRYRPRKRGRKPVKAEPSAGCGAVGFEALGEGRGDQ
jgi:hypothetical protein